LMRELSVNTLATVIPEINFLGLLVSYMNPFF
jgi:hypothetical protein